MCNNITILSCVILNKALQLNDFPFFILCILNWINKMYLIWCQSLRSNSWIWNDHNYKSDALIACCTQASRDDIMDIMHVLRRSEHSRTTIGAPHELTYVSSLGKSWLHPAAPVPCYVSLCLSRDWMYSSAVTASAGWMCANKVTHVLRRQQGECVPTKSHLVSTVSRVNVCQQSHTWSPPSAEWMCANQGTPVLRRQQDECVPTTSHMSSAVAASTSWMCDVTSVCHIVATSDVYE